MLYLPRGIDAFVANKALEAQQDKGTYMIGIICAWAKNNGFTCDHPAYAQKLNKGAKPSLGREPIFKCLICGETYQKRRQY